MRKSAAYEKACITLHFCSSAKFKTRFSWRENLTKWTSFEEQKGTSYILGYIDFVIIIIISCPSSMKPCLEFLLICLARKIKGFYQISQGNKSWFHRRDVCFPENLGSTLKFLKTETRFCRWTSSDYSDITIFLPLLPFCLQKERSEKVFLRLTVSHPKQQ